MSLSPTQQRVLEAALGQPEHVLSVFPAHVKGGARTKVLTALANAGLIGEHADSQKGRPIYAITAAGLKALGIELADLAVDAPANAPSDAFTKPPRLRDGTKQAVLIALLKQPEGVTLAQMAEASGWQIHTIRGFMAGSLKKKLGMNVVSDKLHDQARKYRIA
jgi:DNA-binding PadR family transcriptional regulator